MQLFHTWYQNVSATIELQAQQIKLLICDIDGVFSDGSILLGNNGEELKAFNTKDGFGIKTLIDSGVEVAVITGRKSTIVEKRMSSLGVNHIYQGMENKLTGYQELKLNLQLNDEQIAYIGDDFPDLPVMKKVGLAVAVQDAHPYVKQLAHYTTITHGGKGAVRELTDLIMSAQHGDEFVTQQLIGVSG